MIDKFSLICIMYLQNVICQNIFDVIQKHNIISLIGDIIYKTLYNITIGILNILVNKTIIPKILFAKLI